VFCSARGFLGGKKTGEGRLTDCQLVAKYEAWSGIQIKILSLFVKKKYDFETWFSSRFHS